MAVPYIDEFGQAAATYGAGAPPTPDAPPPVGTATAPKPTPPPAAHPGSVKTGPGYTPDYSYLISHDAGYLSAQANASKSQGDAAARRKAAIQQAITRYGGLPSGFTDQYGDVGQDTLDSAGQNQYSTLAQLARNYGQNEEQFKRGLAARGALQSGDLNYGMDQLENAYGQQRYDAANAVGSDINGALGEYTGVLGNNAQSLSGALQGAEQSVYANPGYTPSAPTTANYDASNSSTYGQPIYADDNGNLFDQNGNPFFPNGPTGTAPTPAPTPDAGPPAPSIDPGSVVPLPETGVTQSMIDAAAPAGSTAASGYIDPAQAAAASTYGVAPQANMNLDDLNAALAAQDQPAESYPGVSSSPPPPTMIGGPSQVAPPTYLPDSTYSYSAPAPSTAPAPDPYTAPQQQQLYFNPETGQYQTTPYVAAGSAWAA